jgi:hypothetical protein
MGSFGVCFGGEGEQRQLGMVLAARLDSCCRLGQGG